MPYFICTKTLQTKPSNPLIRKLARQVREIDPDVTLVSFREPGTGKRRIWAERPDDGMRDHPGRRGLDNRIRALINSTL